MTTSKPITAKAAAILAVVGLVIGAGIYLLLFNQPTPPAGDPPAAVSALPQLTREQATAQLEKLQAAFNAALENDTSIDPIFDRAQALAAQCPDLAGAHLLLAQVYVQLGEFDSALQSLEKSLDINSEQAKVQQMAGTVACQLGRYDQAEHYYAAAMRLEPDVVAHQLFLAQVYIDKQEYKRASHMLLTVLQNDSSQHQAYAQLSDLYARQNKLTLALGQIQKAIESTPVSAIDKQSLYRRQKAKLLLRNQQPDAALMTLQSLMSDEKRKPEVVDEMAICYMMQSRPGKAAELYEKILANDPLNVQLIIGAARWQIKAGNPSAAKEHIARLKRIDPNLPQITDLEKQLQ